MLFLTSYERLSMYQHEGKKISVVHSLEGAPTLSWAFPPGSHDEDPRKIPLWL